MTPEAFALDLVRRFDFKIASSTTSASAIADAIRAAVAEEREACAKVADGFCPYPDQPVGNVKAVGEIIGREIRARGRGEK